MAFRHTPCDTNRLRRFLDSPPTEDSGSCDLAEHLEHCEKCREELEAMAGGRWWNEVRPYVRPATADDPDLRTRAAAHQRAEDADLNFLSPPDHPDQLGRFGPYEVISVLGKGGMGVVLMARDPALNRIVAIKVLSPLLATSGASRQRFDREARAAAAVVHPHVVAIYHVDMDSASGLPYLVMPCIVGRSLQERIDRDGPLEPAAALRIGMQAAAGLAAAHAQGIVHRDVKPGNILLENGIERVVLTDFSLARAVDDASLTQSGVIAGTPQYMSPEQARGEPADHRSDLFSLGSVLYAMCAGHPPFRANSALAVLRRVSDEHPRPIREVSPTIPEGLAAVIERLQAKDPAERFQSANEVAEVLSHLLADLQKPSRRTAKAAPAAAKGLPRRRRWFPGVAAALMLLLFGVFLAVMSSHATHQERVATFVNWASGNGEAEADVREAEQDVRDAEEKLRTALDGVRQAKERAREAVLRAQEEGRQAAEQARQEAQEGIREAEDNVREAQEEVRLAAERMRETSRLLEEAARERARHEAEEQPRPPAPPEPPVPGVAPVLPALPMLVQLPQGPLVKLDKPNGHAVEIIFGKPDNVVVASGKVETRTYDLKDFTAVEVSGPFTLELKQDKAFKVTVTTDDNIFEYLKVQKDGKKLVVGLTADNVNIHESRPDAFKVFVALPELDGLSLNGAVRATADGFKATRPVTLKVNGASRLTGSLKGNELTVDADGASTVKLDGAAKNLRLKATGASQLKLKDFTASGERLIANAVGASTITLKGSVTAGVLTATGASHLQLRDTTLAAADVTVVGSSHATVRVKEKLDYSVIGVSHLEYYGNPKVGKDEAAGSSVVNHHK